MLWHYNGQDQIKQQTSAEGKKYKNKNHPDNRRIYAKIISEPATDTEEHFILAFNQSFSHGNEVLTNIERNCQLQAEVKSEEEVYCINFAISR